MPVIMNIIDTLTKNKPAGSTYFVLWCRTSIRPSCSSTTR
jgi:hypothetical protein